MLVGRPGPTQVAGAGQGCPASGDTSGVARAIGAGAVLPGSVGVPRMQMPSLRPPIPSAIVPPTCPSWFLTLTVTWGVSASQIRQARSLLSGPGSVLR